MSVNARFGTTETEELPSELLVLGSKIQSLPPATRSDLADAYTQVLESVRRRRRILSLVQEALSQLRLDIKYLMFDLEMTRQERDKLKSELEDRS